MHRHLKTGLAVVAAGALFAVGGVTSATASKLITGDDIARNSIKQNDLARESVGSSELKNRLEAKLKGKVGPQGPQGVKGETGPKGDKGEKGDAGGSHVTLVKNLSGAWAPKAGDAAGLTLTGDGVQFGPFANGGGCSTAGVDYARLNFTGVNGMKVSDLNNLAFYARYHADNNTGGVGSPTLRISVSGGNRIAFSPNTQPYGSFAADDFHEWVVTSGTVRLNDDAGDRPQDEKPWAQIVAQLPAGATVTGIDILNGCQAGTNLTSLLRWVQVEGQTYQFGAF